MTKVAPLGYKDVMKPDAAGDIHSKINSDKYSNKAVMPTYQSDNFDSKKSGDTGYWVSTVREEQCRNTSSVDDPSNQRCGCGSCTPECSQKCAHPMLFLLALCAVGFMQSFLVSGYQNSVNTSVERRFDLWSKEWGLVLSSYDFTAMPAVIIASYFGAKRNRARWIGYGAITLAIGSIMFSLPHFVGGRYKVSDLTKTNDSNTYCEFNSTKESGCDEKSPETWALAVLCMAQLILGLGVGPLFTLGPTYIYDNVKRKVYALYMGAFFAISAIGPATGFLLGAAFLSFYVDPENKPTGMTESDPRWVGAWWIGFVMCAGLLFLTAIPFFSFPKKLPARKSKRRWKEVAVPGEEEEDTVIAGFGSDCKDFPRGLKALFTNPVWLCITFASVMDRSIVTGFVAYVSKYMQIAFHVPVSQANIMTGLVLIPSACFGIIIGGVILKRHPLSNSGIFRFMIAFSLIALSLIIGVFFIKCENVPFAGINTSYGTNKISGEANLNISATCNTDCSCNKHRYDPVCGIDQITYFSSCHAGCTIGNGSQMGACGCVNTTQTAVAGKCLSECTMLYPFLVLLFLIGFISSLCQNPALIVTLACVNKKDRSFALGMQDSLVRLLAYIPAPIYFGYIFDSQCLLREETCDRSGSCWEYNMNILPYTLYGMILGLKTLAIVFIVVGLFFSIRADKSSLSQANVTRSSSTVKTTSTKTYRNGQVFVPAENIYAITEGTPTETEPNGVPKNYRIPRSVTDLYLSNDKTNKTSPSVGHRTLRAGVSVDSLMSTMTQSTDL